MVAKKTAKSSREKSGVDKRVNQVEADAATTSSGLESRIVTLENFMNRPAGFAGASHHHDDIYYRQANLYTKTEADTLFAKAANTYSKTQSDERFAPISHGNANHTVNYAPTNHDNTHHSENYITAATGDNRYAPNSHGNANHSVNFALASHTH